MRLEDALGCLERECEEAVDSSLLLPDGESEGEGILLLVRGGEELRLRLPLLVPLFRFFGVEGDCPQCLTGDLDPLLDYGDRPRRVD